MPRFRPVCVRLRAVGRALGVGAALALTVLVSGAAAQTPSPTWEGLGIFPTWPDAVVYRVLFVPPEGAGGSSSQDDVFIVSDAGFFRYAPGGPNNGDWGDWEDRCHISCGPKHGILTVQGTLLIGATAGPTKFSRTSDRGQTWDRDVTLFGVTTFFQSTLPALGGALFLGNIAYTWRSLADGARGSWVQLGPTGGEEVAYAEVPPSAALPNGRLLAAVWNGITYSDDGAVTFRPSSAYGQARYIAQSLVFVPQAGHPYGGVVYAGLWDLAYYPDASGGSVFRSDDGGRTWVAVHRFADGSLYGMARVSWVHVFATPDGVLWAGLANPAEVPGPLPAPGAIVRSTDGGVTWARADARFGGRSVNSLSLSRTGVLYAATERGVWRTTAPVVAVAGEDGPAEASETLGVTVRPNPARGRVEIVVTLAEASAARVVVVDALGREVAVVLDGQAAGEQTVRLDTSAWPAGVYVVRATAGARVATARLVVAR